MVELYGTAFLTAYGERPSPLWMGAIAELTDDQCRKGFTRLASEAREYPANLTQFIGACRYKEPVRFLSPPTSRARLQELTTFRGDPAVGHGWLARIKERVGPVLEPERDPALNHRGHAPCTCQAQGTCHTCLRFAKLMDDADLARGVTA